MDKTYLTFDTETTGLNTSTDQIIEICIQLGEAEEAEIFTQRIRPSVAISAQSQSVHGISAADLENCPSFEEVAEKILGYFERASVIIGYNVTFDLQILQAELNRHKREAISLSDKHIVDPLNMWRHLRPRRLANAYETFCGKELVDAHSAEADVRATAEVFSAMRKEFGLQDSPLREISAISLPSDWIGISNQIKWQGKNPTFGFGKGRGKPVWDYLKENSGYLGWMKRADFLPHVIELCEEAAKRSKTEYLKWVEERYPRAEDS